jgi:hypothetical protein
MEDLGVFGTIDSQCGIESDKSGESRDVARDSITVYKRGLDKSVFETSKNTNQTVIQVAVRVKNATEIASVKGLKVLPLDNDFKS